MNLTQITQLLKVAKLALDLHAEKNAASQVKYIYHQRLRDSGKKFDGLNPDRPEYAEVLEFSKTQYAAHFAAQRRVRNVQRRLDNAWQHVVDIFGRQLQNNLALANHHIRQWARPPRHRQTRVNASL